VSTLLQHMKMLQVSMKFGINIMLLGNHPNFVFIDFLRSVLTTWRLADPLNCEVALTLAIVAITNQPHGVEPFLRSHQLLSYSRISRYSTKSKYLLPCSEERRLHVTLSEINPVDTTPYCFSKIYFNIILPYTSVSS
jgi:hypothetical protein